MAQKKDLNINPYYDDFDKNKNFYKILFSPGRAVQARELTTLQSLLQNQIESFGSHMFKDGSVVIPGNILYDSQFHAVKLNSLNLGIDVSLYLNQLIGKTIKGVVSGITAKVQHIELVSGNNVDYPTIYVKYIDSDNNFVSKQFEDGEELTCNSNIVYGNSVISRDTPFASSIQLNSSATASAAFIGEGVYFVRGFFTRVEEQTLILDYNNNTPSYRVGLNIEETVVTAKDDSSLFDNAKGFSNFSAPGADRLKINLKLSKKDLQDLNDTNFIELLRVENGKVKKIQNKTDYNKIKDYLAERTYDESGDYCVKQFLPSLHNSLNDYLGNNGLFFENQKTPQENTPSEDLACLKVSPGKAYVRGYDVETVSNTILDIEKPRDTEKVEKTNFFFEMGNLLRVNNVTGTPTIDTITLSSRFVGESGTEIGKARVYTFNLTDSAYEDATTSFDLYLYDIQYNTILTLNSAISSNDLPKSSYVKGKSSGASGYAVNAGSNTTTITLRQVNGTFNPGEKLIINGIEFPRTVETQRSYNSQNIKSVSQSNFSANSILERFNMPGGITDVQLSSSGIATAPGRFFTGIRPDTIIRYNSPGVTDEVYNRVVSVGTGNTIELAELNSVSGVFNGTFPSDLVNVRIFAAAPVLRNSNSAYLYEELPDRNISSVDLSNSEIKLSVRVESTYTGTQAQITSSDVSSSIGDVESSQIFFEPFDQEKYSLNYGDGTIQQLHADNVDITPGSITFLNLPNGTGAAITAYVTVKKTDIKTKIKEYQRSKVLSVNKSKYVQSGSTAEVGLGVSSISDGLVYNQYYGLRVQDEEISLESPDVVKLIAVLESLDTDPPKYDLVKFDDTASVGKNTIIGENIVSKTSNAVARVIERADQNGTKTTSTSTNYLNIVYLTEEKFSIGEIVEFVDTNVSSSIETITLGSYKDITRSFTLDKGHREQICDYSRIVRNKNSKEPNRPLKIIFDRYIVPSNDTGDLFTVLSYDNERFNYDIPNIGPFSSRASDTLDFRPRVGSHSSGSSPFDFDSRSLNPNRILSPNESTTIGYDFYLPRIDRLYLSRKGEFIIEKGVSSKFPKPPVKNDAMMEIATISLPPFLYNPQDARFSISDHRRYTMRDIGKINNRVKNLEKVTSLSFLEVSTQTLQIQDSEGRNRFKSGFFVDDFKNYSNMNRNISSVQVDSERGEIVPFISRTSLEPRLEPKNETSDQDYDLANDFELTDSNVQKTGRSVTLKYNEVEWIKQTFATGTENVNPFNVVVYTGIIQLNPAIDNWVSTVQLEDRIMPGQTIPRERLVRESFINDIDVDVTFVNRVQGPDIVRFIAGNGRNGTVVGQSVTDSNHATDTEFTQTLTRNTNEDILEMTDTTVRNVLVSSSSDEFMRSRNTEYSVTNLKPFTKYYQFLDGSSQVDFIPKLIEIATDSTLTNYGASDAFQVGETVIGYHGSVEIIRFRVCTPNHKYGPFNNPTSTFDVNPYIKTESIASTYNSSSKVLNVDTTSLCAQAQGDYHGYITKTPLTKLIGQTSGAEAYVKDLRLISDNYGDLVGSFFLRDPKSTPVPLVRIPTGTKSFRITNSSTNEPGSPGNDQISFAETTYNADGIVQQWQNEVTTDTISLVTTTVTENEFNITSNLNSLTRTTQNIVANYYDPLAQSFVVGGNVEAPSEYDTTDDIDGAYLTSVGLYFSTKDDENAPLRVEIRTVELGTPTMSVVGTPVTLRPSDVLISDDGETETKVTFPEPIYLTPGREYAVVIISAHSDNYRMWTATMGEKTIATQNLPDTESVIYSTQFAMGSLFKSQNGSIWTTNQYQDLKFKLYKAKFVTSPGTVVFHNSPLSYSSRLLNNPIRTLSKEAKLGITTIFDTNVTSFLTPGRKVTGTSAVNNGAFGYIVGTGSSITGVTTTSGGNGYTVDSNVILSTTSLTGSGENFSFKITNVDNGSITGIETVHSGSGYVEGEVVSIGAGQTVGRDARFTVSNISNIDTLYLTDIQGTSNSFVNDTLNYYDDSATLQAATGINIESFTSTDVNTGNHFRVNHFNHGMYSNENKVEIKDVQTDVAPTKLTTPLASDSASPTEIELENTSNFLKFEGIDVTTSSNSGNFGYLKIDNEIISYYKDGTSIKIAERGIAGTKSVSHSSGSLVYKYELKGVSLIRINRDDYTISSLENNMDDYHLSFNRSLTTNAIDRSSDSTNQPQLSFTSDASVGGSLVSASENVLFSQLVPIYDVRTPGNTQVNASIRTVSGTSNGGNEPSFVDQGYEAVQLNALNTLNSVRTIASNVNERNISTLSGLPRSKSFTTGITLNNNGNDTLSPIIYLDSATTDFYIHRLNNPVSDYISDGRTNTITEDPHSAIYVSSTISLAKPATTLKVIVSAYRDSSADFRVLYNLIKQDSNEVSNSFELFPGFNNIKYTIDDDNFIIDPAKNSGLPDSRVNPSLSNEFRQYEFTADNLDLFVGYTIKIVMSGTDQSKYPRIKELRTIAVR